MRWLSPLLLLAVLGGCSVGAVPSTDGGEGGPSGADAGGGEDPAEGDGESACAPIDGASFGSIIRDGPLADRPAAMHADLNPALRGYSEVAEELGTVVIDGADDPLAPRLRDLFADGRTPAMIGTYQVGNWDWEQNAVAGPVTSPEVSLLEVQAVEDGEILKMPDSGYEIGPGAEGRVLYADASSITVVYTARDDIAVGYALVLVDACIEPRLVDRFEADDAAGREVMPMLEPDQPFARARGGAFKVAIRDTGSFLDPRDTGWW